MLAARNLLRGSPGLPFMATKMKKNQTLRAALLSVSALVIAPAALAGPVRIDNGIAMGDTSGTTWGVISNDSAAFGDVLDLGFGFNFGGSVAHSVRINDNGSIDLLENTLSTVSLGTSFTLGQPCRSTN